MCNYPSSCAQSSLVSGTLQKETGNRHPPFISILCSSHVLIHYLIRTQTPHPRGTRLHHNPGHSSLSRRRRSHSRTRRGRSSCQGTWRREFFRRNPTRSILGRTCTLRGSMSRGRCNAKASSKASACTKDPQGVRTPSAPPPKRKQARHYPPPCVSNKKLACSPQGMIRRASQPRR